MEGHQPHQPMERKTVMLLWITTLVILTVMAVASVVIAIHQFAGGPPHVDPYVVPPR